MKISDDDLAEAARRLKARTGAGFRKPYPDTVVVDEMLWKEEVLRANIRHQEEMMRHEEETVRRYQYGDYIDMVQRSDGVWCAPWDLAKRSEDGREEGLGRATSAS